MQKITVPTLCPACSYKLEFVKDQLFCRNLACSAQLGKKLEHFTKTLGIKGFGPKTIEKLDIADLTEIFYLDAEHVVSVLGEKTATKLLDEIERSKVSTLATVIESFSIPLVGSTAATKIAALVTSIDDITNEMCKTAGLGEKVTLNLLNWVNTEYQEIKEFLPFSYTQIKTSNANNKTICITGKLKSFKKKSDAEASLAAAGFNLVDSVTKTTDYLVDEGNSMSAKREKAVQYGITIITDLTQFLDQKKEN